jgi:hypothetical protein
VLLGKKNLSCEDGIVAALFVRHVEVITVVVVQPDPLMALATCTTSDESVEDASRPFPRDFLAVENPRNDQSNPPLYLIPPKTE